MKPIISAHSRIRHPKLFSIGRYSIVDDFCYFSTQVKIGKFCHVASGCSIAGGSRRMFELGDYSSLSSGVKVWCMSNDFANDLVVLNTVGIDIGDAPIMGDVFIGKYSGIGANSVIMPKNYIPAGTVIGALSYVPPKFKLEPWAVYAGIPIRLIGYRNKMRVLRQVEIIQKKLRSKD